MKSLGAFSLSTPRGPWLWVGALNDAAALGGRRAAASISVDPEAGAVLTAALVPFGSLVLGWAPAHRSCGPHLDHHHRCLWRWAPRLRYETPTRRPHTPPATTHTTGYPPGQ